MGALERLSLSSGRYSMAGRVGGNNENVLLIKINHRKRCSGTHQVKTKIRFSSLFAIRGYDDKCK